MTRETTFDQSSSSEVRAERWAVQPPAASLSLASLTPNEVGLMRRLAAGNTNVQIGMDKHRSEKTVRNQLTHLYAKLGASNRAEAVAIYMRLGGL